MNTTILYMEYRAWCTLYNRILIVLGGFGANFNRDLWLCFGPKVTTNLVYTLHDDPFD